MSVFRRGNVWWYEFVFRGQRIRVSTSSRSKTLAEKAQRKHRAELEESANGIRPARRPMLFPAAAREWSSANEARWSKANVAIQHYNLKHLTSYFGAMLLSDITPQHIGKYQTRRQNDKASNRTINMEIATLRMMLKTARFWGDLSPDVKMLPEPLGAGRALTQGEEMRLLGACRRSPSRSLYTAVAVFSNTGLRNAELRCACWRQVDLLNAEFHVGKSKTAAGEGRIVPLNQAALGVLREWRALWTDTKPENYIFPSEKLMFKGAGAPELGIMTPYDVDHSKPMGSWKRAWATAKKQAGVECRMHDLRHCFITKLAETQTSDQTIMSLAGHLNRKMLDRYSHIRAEAKRQAVASLDELSGHTVQ